MKKVFADATWFHWTGITPAISENAARACLEAIKVANEMNITVSCDINYRSSLWKYGKSASEVMPELVAGSDIILGNEEDCEKCLALNLRTLMQTALKARSISLHSFPFATR